MSLIFRHKAQELGIQIRPDGFILVDDILKCSWMVEWSPTVEDLVEITEADDKARFEIFSDSTGSWIRAVQGHSIKDVVEDELLWPIMASDKDLPQECFHGTKLQAWHNDIKIVGLRTMGRNHVHFSPSAPGAAVIPGMRARYEVAISVDLPMALICINYKCQMLSVIIKPQLISVNMN